MTRADLLAAVRAIADEVNAGHATRRRGMSADRAERIVATVLAEVFAIVEPWADNQWAGDTLLRKLRALR